jgi:hypothetical protein
MLDAPSLQPWLPVAAPLESKKNPELALGALWGKPLGDSDGLWRVFNGIAVIVLDVPSATRSGDEVLSKVLILAPEEPGGYAKVTSAGVGGYMQDKVVARRPLLRSHYRDVSERDTLAREKRNKRDGFGIDTYATRRA